MPDSPDITERVAPHRAATAELFDGIRFDLVHCSHTADRRAQVTARLKTADPALRASVAIVLLATVSDANDDLQGPTRTAFLTAELASVDDLQLVLDLVIARDIYSEVPKRLTWVTPAIERAVDRFGEPAQAALLRTLEAAMASIAPRYEFAQNDLRRKHAALWDLARGGAQVDDLLPDSDAWAHAVRTHLDGLDDDRRAEVLQLLSQLSTIPDGPRPTKTWRKSLDEALRSVEGATEVVRFLIDALGDTAITSEQYEWYGDTHTRYAWIAETSHPLARGSIWAALALGEPWAGGAIEAVALLASRKLPGHGPNEPTIANAAIAALGELPPDDAVTHLARVESRIKHKSMRTQVQRALATAAEAAGVTAEELAERSVPRFGLSDAGRFEQILGEHTAVLAVDPTGQASLRFVDATGKTLRGVPAAVKDGHPEELADLKAALKELKATLVAERARVEGLLAADRTWLGAEWRARYLEHPVTGTFGRRLIWEVADDGGTRAVLPALDGDEVADGAIVTLWHPCEQSAAEVRRWRDRLVDEELLQPFKQAYREVYLLTPAEEETGTYSNRFAAHIVRAQQVNALARGRRWDMNTMGAWDGGYDGTARLVFPGANLTAAFYLYLVDDQFDRRGLADLATTDQVRFLPGDARHATAAVALDQVPRRVLSEAFRDVDLFVSVASVTADPTWVDRGDDPFYVHFVDDAFGELGPSAEARLEVLERLLPRLKIADRCSLDGRYLVVRGDRATYRIHLGSANIRIDDTGQYLCIVPARDPKLPAKLFLPFDDDRTLSVILSKAFLLADDTNITDPTILAQIARA